MKKVMPNMIGRLVEMRDRLKCLVKMIVFQTGDLRAVQIV